MDNPDDPSEDKATFPNPVREDKMKLNFAKFRAKYLAAVII